MRRKTLLLGLATTLVLVGSVSLTLFLFLRHERDWYVRMAPPPGHERQIDSQACQARLLRILTGINDRDPEWEEELTDRQINSYFEEDFLRSGLSEQYLPEGISQPRVAIEKDRIRLGFRYGSEPWSTIITIDLKVWLPASPEPNVVAIELQGLHAGGLPISAQSMLEHMFEVARRQNIEVNWYRHDGNPVALLRFQAGQTRPSVVLERLDLEDGKIIIGGKAPEPQTIRAMLFPGRKAEPNVEPNSAAAVFAALTRRER